jgi:hypothetical protein
LSFWLCPFHSWLGLFFFSRHEGVGETAGRRAERLQAQTPSNRGGDRPGGKQGVGSPLESGSQRWRFFSFLRVSCISVPFCLWMVPPGETRLQLQPWRGGVCEAKGTEGALARGATTCNASQAISRPVRLCVQKKRKNARENEENAVAAAVGLFPFLLFVGSCVCAVCTVLPSFQRFLFARALFSLVCLR